MQFKVMQSKVMWWIAMTCNAMPCQVTTWHNIGSENVVLTMNTKCIRVIVHFSKSPAILGLETEVAMPMLYMPAHYSLLYPSPYVCMYDCIHSVCLDGEVRGWKKTTLSTLSYTFTSQSILSRFWNLRKHFQGQTTEDKYWQLAIFCCQHMVIHQGICWRALYNYFNGVKKFCCQVVVVFCDRRLMEIIPTCAHDRTMFHDITQHVCEAARWMDTLGMDSNVCIVVRSNARQWQ